MAWVLPTALAVGSAYAADKNNQALQRQSRRDKEMNAIQTKYSPWLSPNYQQVTNPGSRFAQMLGGGMSGAMMGMALNRGFNVGAPAQPVAANAAASPWQQPFDNAAMNPRTTYRGAPLGMP